VHICTPYLILDGEMETALQFAAQRGVDVTILLPGIPDKKIPYALARTHYGALLDAGVKIYEYVPGFVHAKSFVCDDVEAVVGTINLDYRSLYHHFECAAWLRDTPCIAAMERDFLRTRALCRAVTPRSLHDEPLWRKLVGFVMKAVAPLL
jgi:cardiolipin synthase